MSDFEFEQLEEETLKETDPVLLAVPGPQMPTYIPILIASRVETPYLYDPIGEGQLATAIAGGTAGGNGITTLTFQNFKQLGSTNIPGSPPDVFDLTKDPGMIYEMFMGISPAPLRVFLQQPFGSNQRALPTIQYTPTYLQQGWWNGYISPFYAPSPKARIMVLPGLSIATAYGNPDPDPAPPVLMFWINACRVAVVNDPELAWEMFTKTGRGANTKIRTVGGIQPMSYQPQQYYKITGFQPTADKAAVAKGVTPVG